MDNFLLPLFSVLAAILLTGVCIIYVAVVLDLGLFTWVIVMAMLSPYFVLAVKVDKKRMLNYFKVLLDDKTISWDIDKALDEYQQLLKEKQHHPTSRQGSS